MTEEIKGKTILLLGGTGSLGHAFARRFVGANKLFIFSREENKQWQMKLTFGNHSNLHFIVGNVSDRAAIDRALCLTCPHIIVAAAAMKHIDICERNTQESINTNILGTCNLLASIDCLGLHRLETVLFISTDKACSPINNYGMCKAISETLFIDRAAQERLHLRKYVVVRYGNVLNTRGSIIPLLHQQGKNSSVSAFTLTDPEMTRFVMTLDQSIDLIAYAIQHGDNGTIIVPKLRAMHIHDLVFLFSEQYGKPLHVVGARPSEKVHEALINEAQAARTIARDGYFHIQSALAPVEGNMRARDYSSNDDVLTRAQLRYLLVQEELLSL